jgi:hypothetical protein
MADVKWEQSRLNAAINERLRYPGRDEADIVNNAAYWVARNAIGYTHFTPIARIDTALAVEIAPRVGKRGKPLGYSRTKRNYAGGKGTAMLHPNVPLAALIVQASANYQSVFNTRTNRRYYRAASPFKGKTRAAGRAAMAAAVNKLIKARHSSIKFIASGWLATVRLLAPLVGKATMTEGNPARRGNDSSDERGWTKPATPGKWSVVATIANSTGGAGVNASGFNSALHRYGAPALDVALAEESYKMLAYIRKKEAARTAKFNAMAR